MRVTYSPENGSPQSWAYEPKRVRQSEAEMIEKRAGMSWDEFNKSLMTGGARARKALLWHCLRRDHPVLRWEDVPDFAMAEVQVELDHAELVAVRAAVASSTDTDDETKTTVLAAIDAQLAEVVETDPKPVS